MKTTLLVILSLLCSQTLSQIESQNITNHRDLLKVGKKYSLNPLKQREQLTKEKSFQNDKSKTIVSKILFDNRVLLVEKLTEIWSDSNWLNNFKNDYTYDTNNNMIEESVNWWNNSNWVNSYKISHLYDVNNNLIEKSYRHWDGDEWVNYRPSTRLGVGGLAKITYNYDLKNNKIEELWQNGDGNNLTNSFKKVYTYDVNNNMIEASDHWWDGTNWSNDRIYKYIYDANNNLIEELMQYPNGSDWQNGWKYTYTYDLNNNLIEGLGKEESGGNFIDLWMQSCAYDLNNNLIEELWLWWDVYWVNNGKIIYTYDVNDNMIEELFLLWYGSSWLNSEKNTYIYNTITGIESIKENIPNKIILNQNYPNPFNPITTIKYSVPKQSNVTLKVFDVLGREVSTLLNEEKSTGTYELTWHAENIPSGVYFYQLTVEDFKVTKKLLLMK